MDQTILFRIGPVAITDVLVVSWAVMAVIIGFAAAVRMKLRKDNPGKVQQVVEAMIEWLGAETRNIVNRDPGPFIPVVASLFIFILVSNLFSLVSSFVPGVTPPTANVAVTFGLATVVFFAVPFYGVLMTGAFNYLKTYVHPTWIMLPLNIISDLSRTLALAVRLFGNIFSGEILFGVILSIVPLILPAALMFLSLITGTIQAYIFAVLAIVYIGGAVKVVEKHVEKEAA